MTLASIAGGDAGQQPGKQSHIAVNVGSMASSPILARIHELGPIWFLLGPDSLPNPPRPDLLLLPKLNSALCFSRMVNFSFLWPSSFELCHPPIPDLTSTCEATEMAGSYHPQSSYYGQVFHVFYLTVMLISLCYSLREMRLQRKKWLTHCPKTGKWWSPDLNPSSCPTLCACACTYIYPIMEGGPINPYLLCSSYLQSFWSWSCFKWWGLCWHMGSLWPTLTWGPILALFLWNYIILKLKPGWRRKPWSKIRELGRRKASLWASSYCISCLWASGSHYHTPSLV